MSDHAHGLAPGLEHQVWIAIWEADRPDLPPVEFPSETWAIFWKKRDSNEYRNLLIELGTYPSAGLALELCRARIHADPFRFAKTYSGGTFMPARWDLQLRVKGKPRGETTRAYLWSFGFCGSAGECMAKVERTVKGSRKLQLQAAGGTFYPCRNDLRYEA